MRIIRAPRHESFEIVPRDLVRDPRISYRAKGVAIRLLSNVDGFSMTAQDLGDLSPCERRQAILTAISELIRAGYAMRRKERLANGQFQTVLYVSDTPSFSTSEKSEATKKPKPPQPASGHPTPAEPDAASPNPGNPPPTAEEAARRITTTSLLDWPAELDSAARKLVAESIADLAEPTQQQILDELAGKTRSGQAPRNPISWVRALAARARRNEFVPDAGLTIAKSRRVREEQGLDALRRQNEFLAARERAKDPKARDRTRTAYEQFRSEAGAAVGIPHPD